MIDIERYISTGRTYLGLKNHHGLVDYYNAYCVDKVNPNRKYRMKYSDNWCAMFLSVLAEMVGLDSNQFPYEVSVQYMWEWGIRNSATTYSVDDIRRGDLVTYSWTGNRLEHVGIVVDVDSKLHVLEGNYSKTVGIRSVELNYPKIHGFIMLDTGGQEVDAIERLAVEVIAGKHGDGEARRESLGNLYDEVQKRVNQLLK